MAKGKGKENETEQAANSYKPNTEFDLSSEAKEPGLVPNGTYHGSVVGVVRDYDRACLVWKVTLAENGGTCSDGETPIDGATLSCRNFLPKPGDDKIPSSDGRSNKRQVKINMLAQFADAMKVSMNTMAAIDEAIANGEWIGLEVEIVVETREWNNRVFNDIKQMYALD